MEFLTVHQIHFDKDQLTRLEKCYIPYYNENCTWYFENDVIIKLINDGAHLNSEYFGVVSYKLREKIGVLMRRNWAALPNIANHSFNKFEPEFFESQLKKSMPDVMSFQRHIPHDPISFAVRFHPGFNVFFKEIMTKIGYDYKPELYKNVFYCNYFVAKSHIYEKYVKEMLIPAQKVMDEMPELMGNSNYPQPLPKHLAEKWNINHYPFHAFLCERMFSYFVHLNNYNCLHF